MMGVARLKDFINRFRAIIMIFFLLLLSFFLLTNPLPAQKDLRYLNPQKKLTQYILEHWTTEQGLPSNNVRRLLQSKDGFLWMSSFDGLTSFDGIRFITYNKSKVEGFNRNTVYALTETQDSTLWIGTEGSGLFTYKNGRFRKVGLEDFLFTSLYADSQDRIWLSGRNQGLRIYNPRNGILESVDHAPLQEVSIYSIRQDQDQAFWFATDGKGLTKLRDQDFQTYTTAQGLPSDHVLEVFFDSQQQIWVGTTRGLARWSQDRFEVIPELEGLIIYELVEDASGSLWIATSSGLYRKNALTGQYEAFPKSERFPVTNVLDLLLDREGSLWIATYRNGLFRLKDGKFTNYTHQDGLATASVGSVCELKSGKFLLGMNNGIVNQIDGYEVSVFPVKTPLPKVRIFHIDQDSTGNIWLSTFAGLLKITPQGQEILYNRAKGLSDNTVRVTCIDKEGNLWAGTRRGGVVKMTIQGEILKIYDLNQGLSSNFIMSLEEDPRGNIIVGTNDGGINIIDPEGKIISYGAQHGLVSDLIFSTYTDSEGVIWSVSNGGISRWKDGKFVSYTSQDGLLNDSPFDFVEDNQGQVWLPNSRGIIKVSKQELNDYAEGKIKNINWIFYDRHDGMKNEDCTGAAHALKSTQGNIWIPTNGGVVVVDPDNIPRNHLKPHVQINSLLTDNRSIDLHQPIRIEPGNHRMVFDYSALSLLASAKVKFKYKLENFDKDWIDAGSERQAIYTNLPPGRYTFRVIASNNDGVWNNKGASLSLRQMPYFYQTFWFYGLVVLLAILLIAGIFRWRIYSIQQRRRELERLVQLKTQEILAQNQKLAQQKDEITHQKQLVEKRNQNITHSINYAKRIQNAILPPLAEIQSFLPDSFVIFEPRDIVSGDFYWFKSLNGQVAEKPASTPLQIAAPSERMAIAAMDCTGHGVPGAFMSMIGNDLLNEIVSIKKITSPDAILRELHKSIKRTLKQRDNSNKDGMEIGLCLIDPEQNILEFAGAKTPLYCIQEGELSVFKGDKMPIGGYYQQLEADRVYDKYVIPLKKPSYFYMFSDGYQDQFGEKSRKKFGRSRIRDLLLEIYQKPFEEQKRMLCRTLSEWQGNEDRIDDVLVVGFKI